ncbi:MAG: type II toxin-antitoxin system VapC family toxin [Treponema sp.]|jgi:predicted nucleic acid-binding protein|nr:type II toxin-antitoxin system VapC family toxin [Treponema sp.]
MTAVIDVCGAVEILLQKKKAKQFSKVLYNAALVLAPDLYIPELTNTLWKHCNAKLLSKDECLQYIQEGIDYVDRILNSNEIWYEAFSEGLNNNHSIYDMLYLVTARRNSGILITNDSVLAAICRKNHIQICC